MEGWKSRADKAKRAPHEALGEMRGEKKSSLAQTAIAGSNAVLELFPSYLPARIWLGTALSLLERNEETVKAFESVRKEYETADRFKIERWNAPYAEARAETKRTG